MSVLIFEATLIMVNSVLALLMNLMLFYLVYKERSLQTPFNYFILNLSLADILVSLNMLITMSVNLENSTIIQKYVPCTASGFINILCFVASVMALAAVSINRYYLVVKWNSYHQRFTKRKTKFFLLSVWVFSILLVIPPLIGWGRYGYHPKKFICFAAWNVSLSYMIFMVSMCFMGPISATLLSVVCIIQHKRKLRKAITDATEFQAKNNTNKEEKSYKSRAMQNKKHTKEEYRITLSVIVIIGLFMLSWGPFVIVMFLETVGGQQVPHWVDFGSMALGCMNSTCNPIVYVVMNKNFRGALRKRVFKNKVTSFGSSRSNLFRTRQQHQTQCDQ